MLANFYRLFFIISFVIIKITTNNLENANMPTISYTQVEQIDHARNAVFLFENRFFELNCSSPNADKIIISKDKKVKKILCTSKILKC